MYSLLLVATALAGIAVAVRVLLIWRRQPSGLLLFTVIALAATCISTALAGFGATVGRGDALRDWWALPVLVGIFAFPLTLFTHATLSRRIGFAWARIDWGHGTLCLLAVALLLNGLREVPALRLLEPACWQGVVWYQHAVPAAFVCVGVEPAAPISLPPLSLLAALGAWAGLGLGLRHQQPAFATAMAAAVLLVASAPVLGPLPWFIGQVVGFAAIAWLTGRYAGKLGAS
jgi:hypothetical protein